VAYPNRLPVTSPYVRYGSTAGRSIQAILTYAKLFVDEGGKEVDTMCGRYTLSRTEEIMVRFGIEPTALILSPGSTSALNRPCRLALRGPEPPRFDESGVLSRSGRRARASP